MRRFFTETQFKTHRVNSPQVINLFAYDSSQKCQKIVQLQSLTFLNHDWDDLLLRLTLSLADICCQSKDEQKQKFFSLRSHVLLFSWKKEDRPEWNEFQTTLSKLEGKVFLIRRTLQSAKRRFLAVNCTGLSCKNSEKDASRMTRRDSLCQLLVAILPIQFHSKDVRLNKFYIKIFSWYALSSPFKNFLEVKYTNNLVTWQSIIGRVVMVVVAVSMLAFYSGDPSSIPFQAYRFSCKICVWK